MKHGALVVRPRLAVAVAVGDADVGPDVPCVDRLRGPKVASEWRAGSALVALHQLPQIGQLKMSAI